MPTPQTIGTSRTILGKNTYAAKILTLFGRSSVVAFWPQNEVAGTVSKDISGNAYNGAYTGVTLGAAGIGDGNTAASFDGTTSFNNVYSAGLNAAFNGAEFTFLAWLKMSGVGVWTDGAAHDVFTFLVDANNFVRIQKPTTNGRFDFVAVSGGTTVQVQTTGHAETGWLFAALTNSKSGDAMKAYLGGAQVGTTQTGLGTWAGSLSATRTIIGSTSTVPNNPWSGSIGPVVLLNRAATAAEILQAATV